MSDAVRTTPMLPLQVVPVSDGQVVLKRGVHEMLVTGSDVAALCVRIAQLVNEHVEASDLLERFTESERPQAEMLLRALEARRLIAWEADDDASGALPPAERDYFFAQLGIVQRPVPAITAASVAVYGVNGLSAALVKHLREIGIGKVAVLSDPGLDRTGNDGRVAETTTSPEDGEIVVATCEYGRADALLELNRAAVYSGTRFLPVWMEGFVGHVGPLVVPGESACLRCYALRRDANDTRPDVSAALRQHAVTEGRSTFGVLSPMTAAVGAVAAMEVTKLITGVAPSDAVGRSLEINLVSYGTAARRVLKVPRCPDCSDLARHGTPVVLHGPQISSRWIGLHSDRA